MALDGPQIRGIVERHFRIYDEREQKHRGTVVARGYCLLAPKAEFDARYAQCQKDLVAAYPEALVFVRRDGGEDILFVAERPQAPPPRRGLRIGLFIATLVTTIMAGTQAWASYKRAGEAFGYEIFLDPETLFFGFLTFALPLLLILGIHEGAHWYAAKRHRLRASLPLFIPAPPLGALTIGTFGAFISLRDPLPDRKAMFDVGYSGPLAGFLVALPIVIAGMVLTAQGAVPVPDLDRPLLAIDGGVVVEGLGTGVVAVDVADPADIVVLHLTAPRTLAYSSDASATWDYKLKAVAHLENGSVLEETRKGKLHANDTTLLTFAAGANAKDLRVEATWDDHIGSFGDPLLVILLHPVLDMGDNLTHPLYFAGWVGLLVTGINLLPAGQLDGGHIGRAVFGGYTRYVAYAAVAGLILLAVVFSSWTLMALFVILTGVEHPPPLNDHTPLDTKRKVLAVVMLVVLALTFVPVPFQL